VMTPLPYCVAPLSWQVRQLWNRTDCKCNAHFTQRCNSAMRAARGARTALRRGPPAFAAVMLFGAFTSQAPRVDLALTAQGV
jgi:hypothetical protein